MVEAGIDPPITRSTRNSQARWVIVTVVSD